MADNPHSFGRASFQLTHYIGLLIFVGVLLGTGWTYFQEYKMNQSLAATQAQIKKVESQLAELEAQKLNATIVAQKTVDSVKQNSILWSKVLTDLLAVTPIDVFYRSYSASANGMMTLSVMASSYEAAANLISILNGKPVFSGVFVSSLSRGVSEANESLVTFGITYNVQP